MKQISKYFLTFSFCIIALAGCINFPQSSPALNGDTIQNNISFTENQLYAVAYLGCQSLDTLPFYTQKYLSGSNVPVHYFSAGEYYLIIPRYSNMSLSLYQNQLEPMFSVLRYQEKQAKAFVIQCNVSDIFPDATICLTYEGETVCFSPAISLKDGTVVVGERGLDLTAVHN
ncbi:MAG: hypothetical protein PHG02_06355 [Oscillospiraceae bacterium]|nr:hypothetical protein [Oscillospiraceae bacterium]